MSQLPKLIFLGFAQKYSHIDDAMIGFKILNIYTIQNITKGK
jgi:hypothetical protein